MKLAEQKRQQRARKRARDGWWKANMGEMPDHIRVWADELPFHLDDETEKEPWERAPKHMVEHNPDDGPDALPSLDDGRLRTLAEASRRSRAREVSDRITELKQKYPDRWDKRGQAKVIAFLETEAGDPISERTVQKYFRMSKSSGRT